MNCGRLLLALASCALGCGGKAAAPPDGGGTAFSSDASGDGPAAESAASPPACSNGSRCNGECVELARDDANCGTCGGACSSGLTCVAGFLQDLHTELPGRGMRGRRLRGYVRPLPERQYLRGVHLRSLHAELRGQGLRRRRLRRLVRHLRLRSGLRCGPMHVVRTEVLQLCAQVSRGRRGDSGELR